ncbi:MAG: putative Fe-S cluster assembly protein SufT [Puniceicoccaceae bacterium]
MKSDTRILSRSVEATLIPHGDTVVIPEGIEVTITHRLGGNFTVMTREGMFRIAGKDAEAIGEAVDEIPVDHGASGNGESFAGEDALWDALRKVFDPEIPVNIVDLGLIYNLDPQPLEAGGYHVAASMTLTAPGCGMGPTIAEDARSKLVAVPGVESAEVEIVWDPPWNQDMISEEGKMQLGLI